MRGRGGHTAFKAAAGLALGALSLLVSLLSATSVAGLASCSSFGDSPAGPVDPTNTDAAPDGEVLADGGVGPDVAPGTARAGCADGTREAFEDAPRLAACQGAWTRAGIIDVSGATCGRAAGNDLPAGGDLTGFDCSAADLCAAGWHVCRDFGEVAARNGKNDVCESPKDDAGQVFFATAQGAITDGRCAPGQGFDDVFGCGNVPFQPTGGQCGPLNSRISAYSHPTLFDIPAGNTINERAVVTKRQGPGGVLCCTDAL